MAPIRAAPTWPNELSRKYITGAAAQPMIDDFYALVRAGVAPAGLTQRDLERIPARVPAG